MQMLLLGCTGMTAGLSWCWSAVGVGSSSCGIYQEGVVKRPKVISEDFLKLSL